MEQSRQESNPHYLQCPLSTDDTYLGESRPRDVTTYEINMQRLGFGGRCSGPCGVQLSNSQPPEPYPATSTPRYVFTSLLNMQSLPEACVNMMIATPAVWRRYGVPTLVAFMVAFTSRSAFSQGQSVTSDEIKRSDGWRRL